MAEALQEFDEPTTISARFQADDHFTFESRIEAPDIIFLVV